MSGGSEAVKKGIKLEKIIDNQIIELVSTKYSLSTKKLGATIYHFSSGENFQIFRQAGVYHYLKLKNINLGDFVSKKIFPDMLIINNVRKKIIIIEVKNQTQEGSVDEKLQTGNYKVNYFEKIFLSIDEYMDYSIEYHYVVSDFFKHDKYRDLRNYIHDNELSPKVFLHIGNLPKSILI